MTKATPSSSPIAIVGIGCLFPKAHGPAQYWANLREGVDAITDVPTTHWRPEDHFDADPKAPDMVYAKRGGFLEPIPFEPLKFGIAPRDLEATDTTQLLALHVAAEALEDAGYGEGGRSFDRARTGVVLGVTGALELVIPLGARLSHPIWRRALRDAGVDAETADDVVQRISDSYVPWQENSFPGLLGNVTAGRIANRLDLHGTNCVVDAACASSLSALHLAMLELETGRADVMLSGGVDAFNDVFMYTCFSKTPALSASGDARPFDQSADGTMLGEGVGIVVLKRLADAQRDGDRVYAVVRGMGAASDGKGQAIYAPDSEGQARALRQAYAVTETDPRTIELVEAHGTGTRVGDATELRGLASVYRTDESDDSKPQPWCALGSVKSMIGHTKAAAGVAGVIKAALALHHRVLPPTLKVDQPNEALDEAPAFYVNGTKRPWMAPQGHPRRAAVSAFGFGGSNFHCVLEEASRETTPEAASVAWDGDVQLLAFSADDRTQLASAISSFDGAADWPSVRLAAHESRARFDGAANCRLVMAVQRGGELPAALESAAAAVQTDRRRRWSTPQGFAFSQGPRQGRLGALFPGQGAQAVGMLGDLCCQFPRMAQTVERVLDGLPEVRAALYPPHAWSDETRLAQAEAITATQNAQPALGAVSMGALELLREFGVSFDAAVGHSYGELSALCAAGALPLDALGRVSRSRGELMAADGGDRGTMLAVQASLPQLEAHLQAAGIADVVIANRNAPEQMVCSGPTSAIEAVQHYLEGQGVRVRRLQVAAAFHSPEVAAAREPFEQSLGFVRFSESSFPVYANVSAQPYEASDAAIRQTLAYQIVAPVEFVGCVEAMVSDGVDTVVEIGPGRRLSGLVRSIVGDDVLTTAIDASGGRRPGVFDLGLCLATIAGLGHSVDLRLWDPQPPRARPSNKKVLRVPISGANAKPTPPSRPPVRRSAAASPGSARPVASASTPTPSRSATTTPMGARPAVATTPVGPSAATVASPSAIPTSAIQSSAIPAVPTTLDTALQTSQDTLSALMRLQEQTAMLHQRFLEGQEQALRAFTSLTAAGDVPGPTATPVVPRVEALGVAAAPVASPTPSQPLPPVSAPAPEVRTPTPAVVERPSSPNSESVTRVVLEVVAEKTGYPVEMLEPSMGLDADLGIDSIKRVEILSTLQERRADLQPIGPESLGRLHTLLDVIEHLRGPDGPGSDSGSGSGGAATTEDQPETTAEVAGLVLAVVAEKTGYPPEMLDLGMGLDADLGIDSIKRVEILSTLQERRPDLNAIGPDALGRLQTLGDVVEQLGGSTKADVAAPSPSSAGVGPGLDVAGLVLSIVSEKTGYPQEMLELDMGLDADLGIDSIKRVEIFSTLQERAPSLPAIGPEQLGALQTLRDVVGQLGGSQTGPAPESAPLDITGTLLAVVSEKTGYPVEMLELSMGLDADLGIDSIKRVEILSAIAERMPSAPTVGPEALGQVHTLGDLAQFLGSTSSPAPGVVAPSVPEPPPRAAAELDRYTVTWSGMGPALAQPRSIRAGVVWVTGRAGELGEVAEALRAGGYSVDILAWRAPIPDGAAGLVIVQPNACDDAFVKEAFAVVREAHGVLHAEGAGAPLLLTVTRLGGQFGVLGGAFEPRGGALVGLAKTAAREWPEVCVHAVDGDAALSAPGLRPSIEGIGSAGVVELGTLDGVAGTVALDRTPVPAAEASPLLSNGDAVVVTGGARGVTAAVALELARHWSPTLVLVGRSPRPSDPEPYLDGCRSEAEIKRAILEHPSAPKTPAELGRRVREELAAAEIRGTLAALETLGVQAEYRSVDVRDPKAVQSLVASVRQRWGPIRAWVHGAGVLADKKIVDKSDDDLARVYDTKVSGAVHFLDALNIDELAAVVLFSSSTARFGREGQADYAMANEVLNKMSQRLRHEHPRLRVCSLGWGPWDGGMVTPALARMFAAEGVQTIALASGARFLRDELARAGAAEVLVLGGGSTLEGVVEAGEPSLGSEAELPAGGASAGETIFERTLGVDDHPFLASHAIGGKAVLPAAMMVEWFAHAALAQHPGLRFVGLEGLDVYRGVKIGRADRLAVRIEAGEVDKSEGQFIVPLELCSGGNNGDRVLHARARVVLGATSPVTDAARSLPSLPACGEQMDAIYARRLFHGRALQGITSIDGLADAGINATLRAAPKPKEWMTRPVRGRWITEPLAIDCGLQAVIVWSATQAGAPSLPHRIGAYRQFHPFPVEGAKLGVRISEQTSSRVVADLDWIDDDGRLLATLSGGEFTLDAGLAGAFSRNRVE